MLRKNIRKLICLACILSFCGIMGVKYYFNPQEPVVLETVSDSLTSAGAPSVEQKKADLNLDVKGAVLIDADTGTVIYEQNAHKELPPASVTKVMTMLLVLEAIDDGKAKLSDQVTISERAASMGGSQMYMEVGEVHTLEELLEGIAICSANDACVAYNWEDIWEKKLNTKDNIYNDLLKK